MADWKDLTAMTGARAHAGRARAAAGDRRRDRGRFELPPLAQLPFEEQVFVAAFVKSHGSIKEMERLFGVSYPTIKNRLNRISAAARSEPVGRDRARAEPARDPRSARAR